MTSLKLSKQKKISQKENEQIDQKYRRHHGMQD
jgi:hypothetical protein